MQLLIVAALFTVLADGALLRGHRKENLDMAEDIVQHTRARRAVFDNAVDPAIDALFEEGPEGGLPTTFGLTDAVRDGVAAFDPREATSNFLSSHMLDDFPREIRDALPRMAQQRIHTDPKPNASSDSNEESVSLDEGAVKKAVEQLNSMVGKAQARLDNASIDCREFKEKNTKGRHLVKVDLNRLDAAMTNLEEKKGVITAAIQTEEENTAQAHETLATLAVDYNEARTADAEMLETHQKDLEVAKYMLDITKCPSSLLTTHSSNFLGGHARRTLQIKTCVDSNGSAEYVFGDPLFESSKSRLSTQSRQLLGFALGRVGETAALRAAGLAYGIGSEDLDDGDEDEVPRKLVAFQSKTPIQPHSKAEKKQSNRCARMEPDCGLLHDTFASLWGAMKDTVEELAAKMKADELENIRKKNDVNGQLETSTKETNTLQGTLMETENAYSSTESTKKEKVNELKLLRRSFKKKRRECKNLIREILYTELCGTISVRNEILKTIGTETSKVVDCEVTHWSAGTCEKVPITRYHKSTNDPLPCDDSLKGGTQLLTRETLVARQGDGASCPALNMSKKCNQFKCPVDCVVSAWAGWSQCTKECDGGVQTRSRVVEEQPENAGLVCDTLQDARPCNTDSCDRDCTFKAWSSWNPCSQECGSGIQYRTRAVDVPKLGSGTCRKTHRKHQECNTQACVGDEVCITKTDVVLLIDGSGSLTSAGFEIFKQFAIELVKKFQGDAYGDDAVNVGIVQFGNGHLGAGGVVSDAILVQALSSDMDGAKNQIEQMEWQRGFTNMAQGVLKANRLLDDSLRKDATGTVVMITDGLLTLKRQTYEAVAKLRTKARLMILQVKSFPNKASKDVMKKFASFPARSNYMIIRGKKALKSAYVKLANDVIRTLCPQAESPSSVKKLDSDRGYTLIKTRQVCMDWPAASNEEIVSQDDCKAFADESGSWIDFSYGPSDFYAGKFECHVFKENCTTYEEKEGFQTFETST